MITISKLNEVFFKIDCDSGIKQELSEFFKFQADNYKYTPAFKCGMWDGYIRLFNIKNNTIYSGLTNHIKKFCDINKYKINDPDNLLTIDNKIKKSKVDEFIDSLGLSSKQQLLEVRDYQRAAIYNVINHNKVVLLSATSSGKSMMIYSLFRYYQQRGLKCLLIVPTTSLVEQMFNDFLDYSSLNQWPVDNYTQKLYSGHSKIIDKQILISTWQSLFSITKDNNKFLSDFDVVLVDECHLVPGKSLSTILEKCKYAKYRIGTTGTLTNCLANTLQIEGLLGPVSTVITSKQLIDNKQATDLKIKCLILNYPIEIKKLTKNLLYQEELFYLVQNENRNRFIINLARSLKGNTLILFQLVEKQGKVLKQMLDDYQHEKPIYYISGSVNVDEREEIRTKFGTDDNSILIASYQCCSTGINIPSITNIIFASPTKSKVRSLQSIGRGLRLSTKKEYCNLYDIADNLSYKRHVNFTLSHLGERLKQYSNEEFNYKLIQVDFTG